MSDDAADDCCRQTDDTNTPPGSPEERGQAQGTPDAERTPAKRPGAPAGNANSQLHGLRSAKLPAGARHIENSVQQFRRACLANLQSIFGQPANLYQTAAIQSACRHEQRAQLASRWLRLEPDLSLDERCRLLSEVSKGTESRDRALKLAGLDRLPKAGASDPWALLDAEDAEAPGSLPDELNDETTDEPS